MSLPLGTLESAAMELPQEKRAELAHRLLVSLEDTTDADVEKAWDTEIARRVDEIKRGNVQGKPAMDVLAEIRARYQ